VPQVSNLPLRPLSRYQNGCLTISSHMANPLVVVALHGAWPSVVQLTPVAERRLVRGDVGVSKVWDECSNSSSESDNADFLVADSKFLKVAFGVDDKMLLFNPLVFSMTDLSRNLKLTMSNSSLGEDFPTGKDNVIVSAGRTNVIPAGSIMLTSPGSIMLTTPGC
ncbi:hypothetical protein Tco_0944018, partial [Tanacetum coccineum]